jgi:hypothetical protein
VGAAAHARRCDRRWVWFVVRGEDSGRLGIVSWDKVLGGMRRLVGARAGGLWRSWWW